MVEKMTGICRLPTNSMQCICTSHPFLWAHIPSKVDGTFVIGHLRAHLALGRVVSTLATPPLGTEQPASWGSRTMFVQFGLGSGCGCALCRGLSGEWDAMWAARENPPGLISSGLGYVGSEESSANQVYELAGSSGGWMTNIKIGLN